MYLPGNFYSGDRMGANWNRQFLSPLFFQPERRFGVARLRDALLQ